MKSLLLSLITFCLLGKLSGLTHLNIDGYYAENAPIPLAIESYVEGNNEVVHPDVLYFENGWKGYKYWMVFTPFPESQTQYENPSICVSQDGLNWTTPPGLLNPVVAPFPDSFNPNDYYHSDPDLIMSSDLTTMYIFWREHTGWRYETLNYIYSTDGINWSDTVPVLVVDGSNTEKIISPSLVRDNDNIKMWTVDTKTSPRTIRMRTSISLTNSWSEPIATDLTIINDNIEIWHLDVTFIDNKYYMLASVGSSGNPRGGDLYLAVSDNGINWTVASNPVLQGLNNSWDELIYRATILVNPVNEYLSFKCWYSSDGGTPYDSNYWKIGYTSFMHDDIEEDQTLPVQLTSFTSLISNGRNVKLNWVSQTESELDGYKIYRNTKAYLQELEMLDIYIPATNTSQTQHYSYLDETISSDGTYFYWIQAIDYDGSNEFFGPTKIEISADNQTTNLEIPQTVGLISIYPNPFNPSTNITYYVDIASDILIEIYNIKGQRVKTFDEGEKLPGIYKLVWSNNIASGEVLSSGVYFCRLISNQGREIRKILLQK